MGRLFLDDLGGKRIYCCVHCKTYLTHKGELVSNRFTGSTGRAYLFEKVVNLEYSEIQSRMMITGKHLVRDVMCKSCKNRLGWMYEYAIEEDQRYKESRVILEKALIEERDGIPDPLKISMSSSASIASTHSS
ncbi:hypothetical protein L596_005625 [Steinernema carpocapsae]|uniref:Protein yippee-like n=1 Tax=Steinernema carpocapsae TaxID=34508 RepID=A0A4U8UZL9_STECR|nr:hypothetical protein L596_005625 [Steinernema carpocapsae]